MTTEQKRLTLKRVKELDNELKDIKGIRLELAKGGVQSATLSSGGGTKSFTKMDIGSLDTLISELTKEKEDLLFALGGGTKGTPYMVYSIYQ